MESKEFLRFSLQQDLQVLIEIVEEGSKYCPPHQLHSWLFPSKQYDFVEKFIKEHLILEQGTEKMLLQLIIDRIYVIIGIVLQKIEFFVKKEECINRYILVPKNLTLGCSFRNFWKSIYPFLEYTRSQQTVISTANVSHSSIIKHNESVQTEIISLNKCDSCASAMLCMKNLLQYFENEFPHNKTCKPALMDITQFGCMLQTTSNINIYLEDLMLKLNEKDEDNKLLKSKLESLENDLCCSHRKIVVLENETKIYKEKLKNESEKSLSLASLNQELAKAKTKSDSKVNSLLNVTRNVNKSLLDCKQRIKILHEDNEIFHDTVNKQLIIYQNYNQQLYKISQAFSRLETKIDGFNILITASIKLADVINNRLDNVAKLHQIIDEKFQQSFSEMQSTHAATQKLFGIFKEKLSKILNEKNKEQLELPKFQIKGHPIEDISSQIEENKQKIKSLQTENEKLSKVLAKFKKFV